MPFLNDKSNGKKMIDKVFKAAVKAKEAKLQFGSEAVVDATLGTLFDEQGTFVAFESVWGPFESIPSIQKAKYAASIQGNPRYREAVKQWLFGDDDVPCEIVATPGGAGAVSSTMKNMLNPGEIVIKPNLAWGPYNTMAAEFDLQTMSYNLFQDNQFDIENFKATCTTVMMKQQKVLVIINDPCHNPSGYTLSPVEWDSILSFLDELANQGPVILLHDIAYVDFGNNPTWKNHFKQYKNRSHNLLVVIAFSLSKTLTAYGMRVGAAVAITSDLDALQAFKDATIYSARSIWSTVNNSVMELFATITSTPTLRDAFIHEKQQYVQLIKERADIFVPEALACGLPIYPYKEGFFVTIQVDESSKQAIQERLHENNIFLVEVQNGLRVALCSVPKKQLFGLAERINKCI